MPKLPSDGDGRDLAGSPVTSPAERWDVLDRFRLEDLEPWRRIGGPCSDGLRRRRVAHLLLDDHARSDDPLIELG